MRAFPAGVCPDYHAAALLALVGVVAEYTRIVPEWVMLILFGSLLSLWLLRA